MGLFDKIINTVDANLIYCLIPMVLTLALLEFTFKKRFPTKKALNVIRSIIIGYTILALIYMGVQQLAYPEYPVFTARFKGPYKFAHWFMFLCATALPFTLLIKKLAAKFWYIVLIALLMKSGVYFEQYVILTTSSHRDYAPENSMSTLLNSGRWMSFLQGFVLAVVMVGILEIGGRKKASLNN